MQLEAHDMRPLVSTKQQWKNAENVCLGTDKHNIHISLNFTNIAFSIKHPYILSCLHACLLDATKCILITG